MAAFLFVAGISTYFTLSLIIKSEDTVVVPDLIGKDVVFVLTKLTELELNAKVKGSEYSIEVPKNHVIFQEPKANTEIKKDRDVKIVISRGPQTIVMPNLFGLSLQLARLNLEDLDLCRGVLSYTYDFAVDSSGVIAQSPPSGTMVNRGTCVDLLLSQGPRITSYKMPDLVGLQLDDALMTIDRGHLTHGEIKVRYRQDRPKSSIVEQFPASGSRVEEGQAVNLVVNRRKPVTSSGTRDTASSRGIFRYRIDKGFLKRHIQVQFKKGRFSQDLFNDFVSPDQEIWLIIPTDEEATLLVYEDDRLIRTEVYEN
jgi:serine/threonine-protein kinase